MPTLAARVRRNAYRGSLPVSDFAGIAWYAGVRTTLFAIDLHEQASTVDGGQAQGSMDRRVIESKSCKGDLSCIVAHAILDEDG
jgi:hypothetical protein